MVESQSTSFLAEQDLYLDRSRKSVHINLETARTTGMQYAARNKGGPIKVKSILKQQDSLRGSTPNLDVIEMISSSSFSIFNKSQPLPSLRFKQQSASTKPL